MWAGLITMFFAATGAFAELKDSLNTIWEVQPKPGLALMEMVRDRILSFAMVLVIGFFLLVSLVMSAFLSAANDSLLRYTAIPPLALESGHLVISFAGITILFALIYKVLPDAMVAWRDVWLGAGVTAILFAVGKSLFGLYLGHSTIGSSYGAAGSLVIVVLWTYYSALILLFAAELSQVQARLRGLRILPVEKAVHLTEHARLQQGMPRLEDIEVAARLDEARLVDGRAGSQPAEVAPESAAHPKPLRQKMITACLGFLAGWWLGQRRKD